jgi:hypothetical protein
MTTDPGLRTAKKEVERLEALLGQDPNFRLWKKWKELVDEYERDERARNPASKRVPISTQVIEAAVEILRERKRRDISSDMADAVRDKGITVGGNDVVAAVSAYLSTNAARKKIDNVRGRGYGLVEWGGKDIAPETNGNDPANAEMASTHEGEAA